VKLAGQTVDVVVAAEKVSKLLIRLDDRLLDLDKPVKVTYGGKVLHDGIVPRTAATQIKTLVGRGDPKLVFDAEIAVAIPPDIGEVMAPGQRQALLYECCTQNVDARSDTVGTANRERVRPCDRRFLACRSTPQ
jgi:hypothetical protein